MAAVEVTTEPQRTLPSAAVGVTVTPIGTTWGNSAYVELTASIGSAITIIGVIVDPGAVGTFEVDVARGAPTAEVVVATYIGVARTIAGSNNHICISNIPIDDIASGQRIATRMRIDGTTTLTWTIKLVYYNSVSGTVGVTANHSLAAPSAANGVSLTPSGTAWNNSAYGELHSSLTDIVALGLCFSTSGTGSRDVEFDVATGATSAEVVKGTTAAEAEAMTGFWHLIEFRVPISLPGTNRISCRMRQSGTDVTAWTAKLLYISASGFGTSAIQHTTQPQKITPDAAALPTQSGGMAAWANSAYLELIASTATAIVVVGRTIDTGFTNDNGYEDDVAKGATSAETVVTSHGDYRVSGVGSSNTIPSYIPVDNIPVSTRVAIRHRDGDSSATTAGLGLTYYEKSL